MPTPLLLPLQPHPLVPPFVQAAVAAADHGLLELLESEATAMLQSCAAGVGQLMQLMQKVHAVAVVSDSVAATDEAARAASNAAVGGGKFDRSSADGPANERRAAGVRVAEDNEEAQMLFDERVREVRRSKELLAAQHDVLCQLMLQRGHLERGRYWRARGASADSGGGKER